MHALFVILWSYCLCSLLNPPWCYDVWIHTGSYRLGWYGHWLWGSHGFSSSSHCPVACRVLFPLHVLVHVLVVTMVLVLIRVRLGILLVLGWWC
jgi:hypothetical protein